jgi:LysR family carnitine catabolism transcriptional activator
MDERRLRYFLAVVDEGSITAAAVRLRIAQPSLSQTLRSFEGELGVELFHRLGRGLQLSSAGQALIGPARQALRALEGARDAVAAVSAVTAGSLEIATLATLAADPLAELIGRFRSEHPAVVVRVLESESAAAVGMRVGDGSCELGLGHLPLAQEGITSIALGEQQLLVVLPPGKQVPERPLTAAALADIPLVVSPPGTSTRLLLELALAAARRTPKIAVETAAREAIVPLVLAGAGAALLPAALAYEAQRRGAQLRAAAPRITRRIGLVHRGGPLSPAARAFIATALGAPQSIGWIQDVEKRSAGTAPGTALPQRLSSDPG